METDTTVENTSRYGLISELMYSHKSGVLTIKDKDHPIKIYLKNGILIHAEGLDKETPLIMEIATRKGLDLEQVEELIRLKESDPESLGQTLIGLGLISPSAWEKFLIVRAKQHLVEFLRMDNPDFDFEETEPTIHSINSVNREIIEIVLESIRSIRDKAFFNRIPSDPKIRFKKTPIVSDFEDRVPLNANERDILGLMNGQRTLEDIALITDFSSQELNPILFALVFLGLITPVKKIIDEKDAVDYTEAINLYLDLLKVLEEYFQKEIGKEFQKILRKCQKELIGQAAELFQGIDLVKDDYQDIVKKIYTHFSKFLALGESPLILSTSFNKIIYMLIMKMKEILGMGIAEKVLEEMLGMVGYVEKHRPDAEIMDYLRQNLEDYLAQIRQ